MKVVATDKYALLDLQARELGKIPNAGEVFEIDEEKFNYLSGANSYNVAFVEKYVEKPKTTRKRGKILE